MKSEDLLLYSCGVFDPEECLSGRELAEELMRTKHFTFTDDGYWDGRGCSCCPDYYVESFNCPEVDCNLGSASSLEECYYQSIVTTVGWENLSEEEDLVLFYSNIDVLKQKAKELGIVVEVLDGYLE